MKNISKAARDVGLSAKTIRYYESIDLIPAPLRGENGYRYYSQSCINDLCFIKRARDAGFNLEECKELMQLYKNENRTAAQVKALTLDKIKDIEDRIDKLQSILATLKSLAASCHGGNSSDCSILKQLSKE